MGDAVIWVLVTDVVRKLSSLSIHEFGLLWRLKKDVLALKNDFNLIQAVLEDAEENHTNEKSVELWLKSLRSTSLNVENLLDEVLTEAMMRKLYKERGIKCMVRAFFSTHHNQIMFRARIARKVETIRRELDSIATKRFDLKLTPGPICVDVNVCGEMPDRETSSLIHSSFIFGRNEEMEMVIEKICNKDIVSKHGVEKIRVYAIWGMGGLGKTTLVQLVYNHERVYEYFELKCWMYVSEKFQVKELIRGIIESIDKCECRLSRLDDMQKCLQDKLRGKRFLIVLDDVWIEDSENTKWEQLSKTLSCGAEESVVVMTTRSKRTSRIMAKASELQHELGCLSEKDSWSLFKKLAFAEGREGGDLTELKPIGKKIVEKCKGLPLALKTLGSLMWSKSSTSDWQSVLGSNIWELQDNDILPALKLSYDNLLPHVKRCFAYCCLFPKGYEMEKDLLILLWMTNGLIPTRGDTDWYILGEDIINCLVWKSFFQLVNEKYKMHDLLHELAQYVTRHSCLLINPSTELTTPDQVFHLSSSCPELVFSRQDLENFRSLRSMFIFNSYKGKVSYIFDFVYLRVLYLVKLGSTKLPESIHKLKYLKYLNLSSSSIQMLPESIVYLQNLLVLILERCWDLRKLPEGMRYMRNLQHLNIKYCDSLNFLPVGIKELTRLRILPAFPIAKSNGAQIGELGELNLLEGDLVLSGLENVGGLSEARKANLKGKRKLLVLKLEWRHLFTEETNLETIARDEDVLEGLEPNPCLEYLGITGCMGKFFTLRWMVNLKNLVKITFSWCKNCEQIPPLGRLPSLRVIKLFLMKSLKRLHDDDHISSRDNNMFLGLQELDIRNCPNLGFLPGNFPKLEILTLWECGELVSVPRNLPNLKKLHISACKSLRSLPDEIQSFKDLSEVKIVKCEYISRRYGKDIGEDWPKISHISHISVT